MDGSGINIELIGSEYHTNLKSLIVEAIQLIATRFAEAEIGAAAAKVHFVPRRGSSNQSECCAIDEWPVWGSCDAAFSGRSKVWLGPSTKLCKGRFLRIAAIGADRSERQFTALIASSPTIPPARLLQPFLQRLWVFFAVPL